MKIAVNSNRFHKANRRPRWEGIIFTDIDYNDERISITEAKPTGILSRYIELIWFMNWDISSIEGLQCIVVPNPCSKFVALQNGEVTNRPFIIGPREKAGVFTYKGVGSAIGFDFRPGALYSILKKSMKGWPDSGLYADEFFSNLPPLPKEKWNDEILSQWLNSFENFLLQTLEGSKGPNYEKIFALIEGILEDRFQSADEMAQHVHMSTRTLQRVFQKEVGLSPRDIIRVARFNRAIQQISQDDFTAFAEVALASGFFDQPHMANEFHKLVATPPSKFKRYL